MTAKLQPAKPILLKVSDVIKLDLIFLMFKTMFVSGSCAGFITAVNSIKPLTVF